jgi:glycosyltransferase involved in cell wall biosynthesis
MFLCVPMRICLLAVTYPPAESGGISRQRQVLATELARQGHDVHVVTLSGAGCTRREKGVWVHEIPVSRFNSYSRTYRNLDEPLTFSQALYEGLQHFGSEKPFDIVDVPLWAAQGFITLYHYAGPTVVWLQTTYAQLLKLNKQHPNREDIAQLAIERLCLERANGLLADSHAALASVLNDYRPHLPIPTGIAYLGLPPLDNPTPKRASRSIVEALAVGRLERRKGTPLLFTILPALLHQHSNLVVRFVGHDNSYEDGWHKKHKMTYPEYFRHHYPDLMSRVIFTGYCSETDLTRYYQETDFLLAPSLYESFGLIYVEAMRIGLPVVACATGAATEIFARGESDGGILVPPDDAEQLAATISQIIQRPDLRRQIGDCGIARYQAVFTATAMASATVTFYEQVRT